MRLLDPRAAGGVPVPRPRSPGHEQRVPDQDRITVGHPVHDQHDGTPSLRPVRNDPEQRRQQHIPSAVARGLPVRDEAGGELHLVHGPGHVLQEEEPVHGGRGRRRVRLAERREESS